MVHIRHLIFSNRYFTVNADKQRAERKEMTSRNQTLVDVSLVVFHLAIKRTFSLNLMYVANPMRKKPGWNQSTAINTQLASSLFYFQPGLYCCHLTLVCRLWFWFGKSFFGCPFSVNTANTSICMGYSSFFPPNNQNSSNRSGNPLKYPLNWVNTHFTNF